MNSLTDPERLQQYPYTSRRIVAAASNGMVATSQHLAAQAGLDMLKKGGSAADAAVAAAAVLTVVEPTANGIGSDCFAIISHDGKITGLNSSGPAPRGISTDELKRHGIQQMPKYGWLPVTVPGTPAGWEAISQQYGRLPFSDLMEPACSYAEEGFPVSPVTAAYWALAANNYNKVNQNGIFDEWFRVFTHGGTAPQAGELWRLPDHAQTLAVIGREGSRTFYEGDIARKITAEAALAGGYLQLSDLETYTPDWVEPVSINYHGYTIWELPPNVQGVISLMALGILDTFDLSTTSPEKALHYQIEALKAAFVDGLTYITDRHYMKMPLDYLLSPDYFARRRTLIGQEAALPEPVTLPGGGTVYLAAADSSGMMVSFIQSNYMGFGSGVVIPGTGIALQNRGCSFSLDPGHSNYLEPGKKTYHTIMPGFITHKGQAVGPFGVMGGYMQPQGHLQVVLNMVDGSMNPQAALDAPRWQWTQGKNLLIEDEYPSALRNSLADAGHILSIQPKGSLFGRGQVILKDHQGTLFGGTDPRADGAVCSW